MMFSAIAFLLLATATATAAPADCWQMRKHGHEAEAKRCFNQLTESQDEVVRAEGFWGLKEWDNANEQFRLATRSADSKPIYKVRWGLLLHERFNNQAAAGLFREAIEKDPSSVDAYLGLAIVSSASFDGKAPFYLAKALTLDPKRADAHEELASVALENDDRDLASTEADKAIALENDALDAMAVHAAIELIHDRSPDAWISKITAVNPHYGEAYARIAHHLELHYRQDDAVTYYRKAIEAQPDFWEGHSALGIGLMRMGQQEERSERTRTELQQRLSQRGYC